MFVYFKEEQVSAGHHVPFDFVTPLNVDLLVNNGGSDDPSGESNAKATSQGATTDRTSAGISVRDQVCSSKRFKRHVELSQIGIVFK
jgi:hypothetical protein